MSLAGRPSNIGTRFHNYLYDALGLDFVYKAFTTSDLEGAMRGIRALGIRGCGISMPFKEACIQYVDLVHESADAIESVNTVVNTDGFLDAYNTDYIAVRTLFAQRALSASNSFALSGSGGMAKAVFAALRDSGLHSGTVIARNQQTGEALAARYGYSWQAELAGEPQLLINATPVGMAGGPAADDLPFPERAVRTAATVFEMVAVPEVTPLVRLARSLGKAVITGAEVIRLQAIEQFVLYTGVRPTDDEIQRAAKFSRS
jgi:shikimate dehydrogenase